MGNIKNHLKSYSLIYLLGSFFVVLSVLYPEAKIEVTGGFAWLTVFIAWLIGLSMIYIGIMGGKITYSSKGLKGWVKERKSIKSKEKEM